MSSLRHPDWHLIAEQCFRRRAAVTLSHQLFRGEPCLVLSDRLGGQHVRLSAQAQDLWAALDGRRSTQDIWEEMMTRPWAAPAQRDLVSWIMQLLQSGLILSDQETQSIHVSRRKSDRAGGKIEQKAMSPLAIKLPLFDPDPLIRAIWPVARHTFTRTGALVIGIIHLVALVMALVFGAGLVSGLDSAQLSQTGLWGVALVYPVMKILHELAHCCVLYSYGGRVRECGVMLLLFFPVPYVDASDATFLPDKWQRMMVGAAGIIAETLMASIAFLLWMNMPPGVERALLFNVMLIGTVSTILFNGNPLLKFDAYYVLSDWLEIPNLAQRAGDLLSDGFLGRVVGLRTDHAPEPGTAAILMGFGVLSLGYRLILTLSIALIVSNWFFVLGLALAIWTIFMGAIWPLLKLAKRGWSMARAQNRQGAGLMRLGITGALAAGLLFLVPFPFSAVGEGRILPGSATRIVAGTSGILGSGSVGEGADLTARDVIATLSSAQTSARRDALALGLRYLNEALEVGGLAPAEIQRIERERSLSLAALDEAASQVAALELRAPIDGRMAWAGGAPPAPGSYVLRGDTLGHVVNAGALDLVVALPVAFSGIAGEAPGQLVLRLPDGTGFSARVLRQQVVDAGQPVPPELLARAGGPIAEQPDNPGHALTGGWIIWAAPDVDLSHSAGMRVEARLDLGRASLARQIGFQLQRLFLGVRRL